MEVHLEGPAPLQHTSNRMDTLGIEPRAFRMRSGCDTTTACALEWRCTLRVTMFARDACIGNSQALT